jgi:hypothetical protein
VVTETVAESLDEIQDRRAAEEADPRQRVGLLRLGGERRGHGTSQRRQQEAPAVHHSIT